MKQLTSSRLLIFACTLGIIVSACKKEDWEKGVPPNTNKPPIAYAGRDTTLYYPNKQITLDASQSYDPEGGTLYYSWRSLNQQQPIGIYSVGSNNPTTRVEFYEIGIYKIELDVVDNKNYHNLDTIEITYGVQNSLKKGQVLEWGTWLPIEGIQVEVCRPADPSVLCTTPDTSITSDVNGYINFQSRQYAIMNIPNLDDKVYWDLRPVFSNLNNAMYYLQYSNNQSHKDDNFFIGLIPKVTRPVRIIDTSHFKSATLGIGIYDEFEGYTSLYSKKLIPLRSGIDSTLDLTFFGNTKNSITINEKWEVLPDGTTYPIYWDSYFDQVYAIQKGSKDTIVIKY